MNMNGGNRRNNRGMPFVEDDSTHHSTFSTDFASFFVGRSHHRGQEQQQHSIGKSFKNNNNNNNKGPAGRRFLLSNSNRQTSDLLNATIHKRGRGRTANSSCEENNAAMIAAIAAAAAVAADVSATEANSKSKKTVDRRDLGSSTIEDAHAVAAHCNTTMNGRAFNVEGSVMKKSNNSNNNSNSDNNNIMDITSSMIHRHETAKEIFDTEFQHSQIENRTEEFPMFARDELQLGKILGKGGFATVSEIRGFHLESSSMNLISQALGVSSRSIRSATTSNNPKNATTSTSTSRHNITTINTQMTVNEDDDMMIDDDPDDEKQNDHQKNETEVAIESSSNEKKDENNENDDGTMKEEHDEEEEESHNVDDTDAVSSDDSTMDPVYNIEKRRMMSGSFRFAALRNVKKQQPAMTTATVSSSSSSLLSVANNPTAANDAARIATDDHNWAMSIQDGLKLENAEESRKFISQHCFRNGGDARYAIKELSNEIKQADADTLLEAIVDMATETRFLSALNHPNVIKLRATAVINPFDSKYFIILDRLYDTLGQRLDKWEKQSKQYTSFIRGKILGIDRKGTKQQRLLQERMMNIYHLSTAICYIHEKHIIHRDIKPENIGFDIRGDIKIFDFSLAKEIPSKQESLQHHKSDSNGLYSHFTAMCGTPRYMAPEVALGKPYNESCDVYSFAILVWQMLTLQKPYSRECKTMSMIQDKVWSGPNLRPKLYKHWSSTMKMLLYRSWSPKLKDRPSMKHIVQTLRKENMTSF